MKCTNCGKTMRVTRESYRDREIGLPNIILTNIEIRRCPECGEEQVVIPAVRRLHDAIAHFLIEKRTRFNGDEIRFLRTHLGWSQRDFAKQFGVEMETVSRWENNKLQMSAQADRLLRMAIVHGEPAANYPLERLGDVANGDPEPLKLKLRAKKESWELVEA